MVEWPVSESHPHDARRTSTESGRRPASESGRLGVGSGRWSRPPWVPTQDVVAFTDASFEREVLASELPVIVDFWAETCVPCRRQEPTIEQIAAELRGQARVGRLNVYDEPKTPERFQIKGVPHLLVIHRGEVVLELVGDHSIEQLRSYVLPAIGLR